MKKIFYYSSAIVMTFAMASCSDSDDVDSAEKEYLSHDVTYVLTQGNFYSGVKGSLDIIDNKTFEISTDVFQAANQRTLGDTPQCGVAYGSKVYVGTSQSNTIEIMDSKTFVSYKQIKLAENPEHGTGPRSMVAYKGKVFISMYDGYLARLDTLTMTIDKSVKVGPNPEEIAELNGKIYVPLSDGMNYPNYGTTACVVDAMTMVKEKEFTVALNPTQFIASEGRLFLLCKGNYGDVASKLYKINADLSSKEVCDATIVAAAGDDLVVLNQPFSYDLPAPVYYEYDVKSEKLKEITFENVDYANQIYYDNRNDLFFVASYVMNGQYPSYDMPGYVNVYDDDFKLLKRCNLSSAGPACIFSWKR